MKRSSVRSIEEAMFTTSEAARPRRSSTVLGGRGRFRCHPRALRGAAILTATVRGVLTAHRVERRSAKANVNVMAIVRQLS